MSVPVQHLSAPQQTPILDHAREEFARRAALSLAGRREPEPSPGLAIASVLSLSTRAFPGERAAVVYCAPPPGWGLSATPTSRYTWRAVEHFLSRWSPRLTAVAFSGYEPVGQPGLIDAVQRARGLGLAAAVHTDGAHPGRLAAALPLLDWVSLFVPLTEEGLNDGLRECIHALTLSGVPFECWSRSGDPDGGVAAGLATAVALSAAGVRSYRVECGEAGMSAEERAMWRDLGRWFPSFSLAGGEDDR